MRFSPLFSPDPDDRLSPNFDMFVILSTSCDTRSMGLWTIMFTSETSFLQSLFLRLSSKNISLKLWKFLYFSKAPIEKLKVNTSTVPRMKWLNRIGQLESTLLNKLCIVWMKHTLGKNGFIINKLIKSKTSCYQSNWTHSPLYPGVKLYSNNRKQFMNDFLDCFLDGSFSMVPG